MSDLKKENKSNERMEGNRKNNFRFQKNVYDRKAVIVMKRDKETMKYFNMKYLYVNKHGEEYIKSKKYGTKYCMEELKLKYPNHITNLGEHQIVNSIEYWMSVKIGLVYKNNKTRPPFDKK
jgi:hypothetical protein